MERKAKRTKRELTDDERQRLDRYRQQIDTELPSLCSRAREVEDELRETASLERTVSGQLRRAVSNSGLPLQEIAARLGVEGGQIAEFMVGRHSLDSTAIDRLAALLNQELRPPIR